MINVGQSYFYQLLVKQKHKKEKKHKKNKICYSEKIALRARSVVLLKFWVCIDTVTSALSTVFPANKYMFEVDDRNNGKKCKTFSKLTIKTPEQYPLLYPRKTCFLGFSVPLKHILVQILKWNSIMCNSVA